MSALAQAFERARAQGRAALVTFVTAGDPSVTHTPEILAALVAGGADIIELGMPFTDPMADGPAIQRANIRALSNGISLHDIFGLAGDFTSEHDIPLVLMGYANTMLPLGPESFADSAAKAGVSGVICVDIPPEEDAELGPALRAAGIDLIRLATPTTDDKRLPTVLNGASGFLYYVSVAGITGLQQAAQSSIEAAVARIKAATDLPVVVGFGVRTPEQAAAIGKVANGVVVGSAIVELVEKYGAEAPPYIETYVRSLADALVRQEEQA